MSLKDPSQAMNTRYAASRCLRSTARPAPRRLCKEIATQVTVAAVFLAGLAVGPVMAAGVGDCEGALVISTYSKISKSHEYAELTSLVTEDVYNEIKQKAGGSTTIFGIPVGANFADFKKRAESSMSQSSEKTTHDEMLNILWTGLDNNAVSVYSDCINAAAKSEGLHISVRSATTVDITVLVTWTPKGTNPQIAHLEWSVLSDAALSQSLPPEITAGDQIVVVPRPSAEKTLAVNTAGYGDSVTLTPLPAKICCGDEFTEAILDQSLLVDGSVKSVHPGAGGSCKPAYFCVDGLTFGRPYFRSTRGVDMAGVSAPDNTFGVGIHPADKKVGKAAFYVPEGANWLKGFAGLAKDGKCGAAAGDVTVLIETWNGNAFSEVRRYELRGMNGPPGDFETKPIGVSGSPRIRIEVDSNGDYYCDNVFLAGARFTRN
jgi:hypothetical protein